MSLRPVHILGTVHNAPSNFLRLDPILTVMGYDPMAQVVHQSDVVRAIELALRPGIRGIFNLAGPEPVPLSHLIKILGRQRVSVPYSLARVVLRRLWSLRLTTFPPPELDHIRYVCMVDDRRARQVLGFAPSMSLEETVIISSTASNAFIAILLGACARRLDTLEGSNRPQRSPRSLRRTLEPVDALAR